MVGCKNACLCECLLKGTKNVSPVCPQGSLQWFAREHQGVRPNMTQLNVNKPAHLSGGKWVISGFSLCSILVGRNGSGKSQLLRSVRDLKPDTSHYVVPERSGEINFNANLISEIDNAAGLRNRTSGNFAEQYRSVTVTRVQHYYTVRGTKSKMELYDDPSVYFSLIEKLLPDFRLKDKTSNPYYELKRISTDAVVPNVSHLSSGESQLLTLGLDICMTIALWKIEGKKDCILLVDEPDAHIHPDLQVRFAAFLKSCSVVHPEMKIVTATHSMTLVSALCLAFGGESGVCHLSPSDNEVRFRPASTVQQEIYSILGGHILLSYLFGHPILLVEGDDDFQAWVHIARGKQNGLAILPTNGDEIKKYRLTLERTLSTICDSPHIMGFALLDGDKPLPVANPQSPQDFIKFIRLDCREIENLYITDEMLSELGYTSWDDACSLIENNSGAYGEKSSSLMSIRGIDRKTSDLKGIIHQIAEILDPKRLSWTVRLGKTIAKIEPSGMLADYLGKDAAKLLTTNWSNQSLTGST